MEEEELYLEGMDATSPQPTTSAGALPSGVAAACEDIPSASMLAAVMLPRRSAVCRGACHAMSCLVRACSAMSATHLA
eukprot:1449170-Rhodomonas_salina.3